MGNIYSVHFEPAAEVLGTLINIIVESFPGIFKIEIYKDCRVLVSFQNSPGKLKEPLICFDYVKSPDDSEDDRLEAEVGYPLAVSYWIMDRIRHEFAKKFFGRVQNLAGGFDSPNPEKFATFVGFMGSSYHLSELNIIRDQQDLLPEGMKKFTEELLARHTLGEG